MSIINILIVVFTGIFCGLIGYSISPQSGFLKYLLFMYHNRNIQPEMLDYSFFSTEDLWHMFRTAHSVMGAALQELITRGETVNLPLDEEHFP